ncbi:MAG: hypothetical protein Q6J68_04935 [Thermostichales cyanobacterium SZTDM-1c_bins_54]
MSKRHWLVRMRAYHRLLAPVVLLPFVVTLVTGSLYHVALMMGNFDFYWLIEMHKGKYGPVDLSAVYPFLNALALLFMVSSGFSLWWQSRQARRRPQSPRS